MAEIPVEIRLVEVEAVPVLAVPVFEEEVVISDPGMIILEVELEPEVVVGKEVSETTAKVMGRAITKVVRQADLKVAVTLQDEAVVLEEDLAVEVVETVLVVVPVTYVFLDLSGTTLIFVHSKRISMYLIRQ